LVATFPCGHGLVYWAVGTAAEPGANDDPDTIKQHLGSILEGSPSYLRELIDATPPEAIIRAEIYDRDPASSWVAGRVALLGDAAHLTSPFVGQGAGMAVEDAVALARELALTGGLEDQRMVSAALEAYQDKRLERANSTVLSARKRGKLLSMGNPVACALRNAFLKLMPQGAMSRGLSRSTEYSV
jgi:2-polyprenyl-6-methoxyphenol hydroxylase-like FAD-dependent oxidoreductase